MKNEQLRIKNESERAGFGTSMTPPRSAARIACLPVFILHCSFFIVHLFRRQPRLVPAFAILAALLFALPATAQEPWTTYRGNSQRTGCTDDIPAPDSPTI